MYRRGGKILISCRQKYFLKKEGEEREGGGEEGEEKEEEMVQRRSVFSMLTRFCFHQ